MVPSITTKVAGLLPTVPALLLAMARYVALSFVVRLCNVNVDSVAPARSVPFFFH